MYYIAFVGWKIVARGRFSRVGLSLVYERLTSPAKGFAPFLAPLGARGDLQDSGRRPNYRIPVAARWNYRIPVGCRWRSTYSLPMLYQYYRQLPIITVCLWPAYGIGNGIAVAQIGGCRQSTVRQR